MRIELQGSLGEFPYDEATKAALSAFIQQAVPLTKTFIEKEIHHISRETARSLWAEQSSFKEGKVATLIEHAKKLEYRDSPFMRPGARKAKRKFNALAKKVFGDSFRAWTRTKGKRTKFVKGLAGKLAGMK